MAKATHIAVISIPSFSHQASIVAFCKRLVHLHPNFHVTCIFPTIGTPNPSSFAFLDSLPSNIDYIFLPPVNKEDLPQDVSQAVQCNLAVSQSMPYFRDTLGSLCSTTPMVALVADPFANEALKIAKEFNLLSYVYLPLSAMALALLLHLPTLHEEVSCEYKDHTRPIQIPGCVPIHGRDLPEHFEDRSNVAYDLILQYSKRISTADGFLVNSFLEMEEGTLKAFQECNRANKNAPVYLVGPIIQIGPINESNGSECLRWLENQKPKSVLYVSFGSGSTVSQEQLDQLALGLELSGQKFLWVLRAPSDPRNCNYLGSTNNDPLLFLPHGFLERTKGQGLVVPFWAPQTQILSHTSTGGFLTHCGWNSILESILAGVPMIALPLLFGELMMNAILLTEGQNVALRPKCCGNGIVEKEAIAEVIKGLLVGEQGHGARQRIVELKEAAVDALKDDGSSTRALSQFSTEVKNFVINH
ncbi:hydroquinone glucosyltransferase-like [Gastrolobium bilobum]|uniref:hydroquinone glucosyltransferase-like n=1 Tax=Gastrolobium bilobum TaxID=150636 RepID=UPI002AB03D9A|nr:hydroquinone glucosyltransferase-like [Gastrolobium bilobum]